MKKRRGSSRRLARLFIRTCIRPARGFMVAVDFANPGTQKPDAPCAGRVRIDALKFGLILLTFGAAAT